MKAKKGIIVGGSAERARMKGLMRVSRAPPEIVAPIVSYI